MMVPVQSSVTTSRRDALIARCLICCVFACLIVTEGKHSLKLDGHFAKERNARRAHIDVTVKDKAAPKWANYLLALLAIFFSLKYGGGTIEGPKI